MNNKDLINAPGSNQLTKEEKQRFKAERKAMYAEKRRAESLARKPKSELPTVISKGKTIQEEVSNAVAESTAKILMAAFVALSPTAKERFIEMIEAYRSENKRHKIKRKPQIPGITAAEAALIKFHNLNSDNSNSEKTERHLSGQTKDRPQKATSTVFSSGAKYCESCGQYHIGGICH